MCFQYHASIVSLNSKSFISNTTKENSSFEYPIPYDSLNLINKSDIIWNNSSSLYDIVPSVGSTIPSLKSCFIGFKINNKIGWMKISPITYGVHFGIKLENYAINYTENNNIKAGQQK